MLESRTPQQERGEVHLALFIEGNPEYSVDDEQPKCRQGTHFVTFGKYRGEPVVFKYYDGDPRKEHEKWALELFAPTGLVPKLYPDETDVMLVMERLPGRTIYETEKHLNQSELDELYFQLGKAVAKVVETAPGSNLAVHSKTAIPATSEHDFYKTLYDALHVLYRQADTATFFDTTLACAARVLRDRDVAYKEVLNRSLTALQQNRNPILSYPDFVHMDDFHTNNIMAEGTRITGFIDLEMTRYGNEILLLGAALCSMCNQPGRWESFLPGYEHGRGKPMEDAVLSLVKNVAPFTRWIRFTWYWGTEDIPKWAAGMNLRKGAVEDVVETVKAIEKMQL